MKAHDIWKLGWLRQKPYCYNPKHPMFNPALDNIIRDLRRGENRIILVVGTPRSGKSAFSLWLQCYFNYCYFADISYAPNESNLQPLKDIYWKLDEFIQATRNPENQNKFITLEEQGVEQYKMDFVNRNSGIQQFDKLQQIFGIDNTNLIINFPYIFDIQKGTRLKAHYLFRAKRKTKKRVNVVLCNKRMNVTTDKAYYKPSAVWNNAPFVGDIYPDMFNEYVKMKLKYNLDKKEELFMSVHRKAKAKNIW